MSMKTVDGVRVELTPEEQADLDARNTAHEAWLVEYNAQQYSRDRASEYPSIGDQLDALFHAGVFPEEMAATIQAVKDKYPKGGS